MRGPFFSKSLEGACCLLALAALLLAYGPAIPGPFFLVDDKALVNIPQLQRGLSFQLLETLFTPGNHVDFYPLRDLSYWLDIHVFNAPIGGEIGTIFRLHNLFLFLSSALFLYFALIELNISQRWSMAISLGWLLHPVHAETILWISGRKDALAIFFGLACFYFFLNFENKNRLASLILSSLFYILGLLSKASCSLLPIVGLFWCLISPKERRRKPKLALLTGFTLISLINSCLQGYLYSQYNDMRFYYPTKTRITSAITALGKMAGGWFYYPINTLDIFNWGDWAKLNEGFLAPGIAFIIAIAAFAWPNRKSNSTKIALVAFLAMYIPISGLIFPHENFYSVRYFEVPALAFLIAFASFTSKKRQIIPKFLTKLPFLLTALFVLLLGDFQEGSLWASSLSVVQRSLNQAPTNVGMRTLKIQELQNLKKWGQIESSQTKEYISIKNELATECGPRLEHPIPASGDLCSVYFAYIKGEYEANPSTENNENLIKINKWLETHYLLRTRKQRNDMKNYFAVNRFPQDSADLAIPSIGRIASPQAETKEIGRLKIWLLNCKNGKELEANIYIGELEKKGLLRAQFINDILPSLLRKNSNKLHYHVNSTLTCPH